MILRDKGQFWIHPSFSILPTPHPCLPPRVWHSPLLSRELQSLGPYLKGATPSLWKQEIQTGQKTRVTCQLWEQLFPRKVFDTRWLECTSLHYSSWMGCLMVLPRKCWGISSGSSQEQTLPAKSALSSTSAPRLALWTDQGRENARANPGSWGLGETDIERQPHADFFMNKDTHGWCLAELNERKHSVL